MADWLLNVGRSEEVEGFEFMDLVGEGGGIRVEFGMAKPIAD
jgi:hypothetical protein